jgi:hypothetical protein
MDKVASFAGQSTVLVLLGIVLAFAGTFLAGCSAEGAVTTTSTAFASVTTDTASTISDGVHFGFVRQVATDTLTVDPAEFLSGEEALKAARADGAIGATEDLPDPYYIDNPTEEELLLAVDPAAHFTLLVAPEQSELVQKTVSIGELARLWSGAAQDPHAPYYTDFANGLPMDLTISEGHVTGGVEKYLP